MPLFLHDKLNLKLILVYSPELQLKANAGEIKKARRKKLTKERKSDSEVILRSLNNVWGTNKVK